MFKERFCEKLARFDLRADDVVKILEKSQRPPQTNQDEPFSTPVKDTKARAGSSKTPTKEAVKATELLAALRASIQDEIPELSFDYLTLHRVCSRLLMATKDKVWDRIKRVSTIYSEGQGAPLAHLPMYLFHLGMEMQKQAPEQHATPEVTKALWRVSARVLEKMLAAGKGDGVGAVLRERLGVNAVSKLVDDDVD